MQGAYWVGQDGNVWVKDANGTKNWGSASDFTLGNDFVQGNYTSNNKYSKMLGEGVGSARLQQIADPMVQQWGSDAPVSGGAAPRPVLNQAAINNTQMAIDQIPGLLEAALAAERQSKENALNAFNAQETQQRGTYDTSTVTNQQNYDANFMDSIRAGIKGLGSLTSLLRGTGAAGGTAQDMVRDTVGGITADDIRTGADTQKENQTELDSVLSSFLTELRGKRQTAEDTFMNNERAIRRDTNTQLQDLFGKMAGYYSEGGDTGRANEWMGRAGALTPEIANNSRRQVSAYDTTPVVARAPQVTAFAEPSQPQAVTAPRDGQVGAGIFTMGRRRGEERREPLAVSAGV